MPAAPAPLPIVDLVCRLMPGAAPPAVLTALRNRIEAAGLTPLVLGSSSSGFGAVHIEVRRADRDHMVAWLRAQPEVDDVFHLIDPVDAPPPADREL